MYPAKKQVAPLSVYKKPARTIHVGSRALGAFTCPLCWTTQRSNRNTCYRCGAQVVYLAAPPASAQPDT